MWKEGDGGKDMSKLLELDEKQLRSFRKLVVIGDLHGDFESLQLALSITHHDRDGIIFLGDYGDRGPCGVEVINAVDSLLRKHLGNVFALKGNHEHYSPYGRPNFGLDLQSLISEAEAKTGSWEGYFNRKFKPFMDKLHLAAIAEGEILFVHGGVSSKIGGLDDLKSPSKEVEEAVLWSDPGEGKGEYFNSRGIGVVYGPDVSKSVCQKLGVKRIVRSHEPSRVMEAGGPCYSHDGRVITTSTTTCGYPRYRPFILRIDPADFSVKCLRVDADQPVESEVVNCRSPFGDV